MSSISTVIIRLTDEDRDTKGGMHILAQLVSNYLRDQFDLEVAVRIEDERGEKITELVPLRAVTTVESHTLGDDDVGVMPASLSGLIGN